MNLFGTRYFFYKKILYINHHIWQQNNYYETTEFRPIWDKNLHLTYILYCIWETMLTPSMIMNEFSQLPHAAQYKKTVDILAWLREEGELYANLYQMVTTMKDAVTSSILTTIYGSIMKLGYEIEHDELTQDADDALHALQPMKHLETSLEQEKIQSDLERVYQELLKQPQ